jgi:hypothetical protein
MSSPVFTTAVICAQAAQEARAADAAAENCYFHSFTIVAAGGP